MLKTQRFSSLFRHYAKHHGLRKVPITLVGSWGGGFDFGQARRLCTKLRVALVPHGPIRAHTLALRPAPALFAYATLPFPLQEDLSFFFCEELQNDDTPESVFLQKNDEIVVRKRKAPPPPAPVGAADTGYFKQMRR